MDTGARKSYLGPSATIGSVEMTLRRKPLLKWLLVALAAITGASAQSRIYRVVDVQSVRATGDPAQWVRTVQAPEKVAEVNCDILVAGGGMGGVAAAMRALDRGHTVCLTEATDWLGGQMTAGGVAALDEHKFIELTGGTRTYYELRHRIRRHYRERFTLAPQLAGRIDLNPGACYVSSLCFEPRVGVQVIEDMLATRKAKLQRFMRTEIIDLDVSGGVIQSALAYRLDRGEVFRIRARFVLDATELGDLLPLARVPYTAGSEPRSETGEPHAGEKANPACVQSFTYPFAIERTATPAHGIAKPPEYESFRDSQRFSFLLTYPPELGWKGPVQYVMFGEDPPIPNNQSPASFFSWRRLLARKNFTGADAPADLALINWPRQDYSAESLLDRNPLDIARVLQRAKRASLAFLYWLHTEVPRDDRQGSGYPELKLRPDVMDTDDGLSKYPYIRESRRLKTAVTVIEQDIVAEYQTGSRARWFGDSVGTAFYMVDIHPCGAGERGRMMMPRPFQIPMGTMIPQRIRNLLAAGKNIGVTHVTNGAFRLHPVEWNVGEAAAVIASLALARGSLPPPQPVQEELAAAGVPLVWFDDLPVDHPAFAAIQLTAMSRIYPLSNTDLHAAPDAPVTRAEAAQALFMLFAAKPGSPPPHADAAISVAVEHGWMATDHRNWFHPDLPFHWTDWREEKLPFTLPPVVIKRNGPVTRAELAQRLVKAR